MSGAVRHDAGKEPVELVPASLVLEVAKVLEFGAKKYAPRNWEKGMDWSRVMGSLERHWLKFKDPSQSDVDEETGLSHLAHVACNIAFLIEYTKTHPELDNRFNPYLGRNNNDLRLPQFGLTDEDLDNMAREQELEERKNAYFQNGNTNCI